MDFIFHEEMVYGKKHVNKLSYDNSKYDFRDIVKNCFKVKDLSVVHKNNPEYDVFKEFGPDVQTWYHDTFYNYLKTTDEGSNMQKMYDNLVVEVILPYLGIKEALVQKFPSFRVQLPGNIAVAKMHTDNSLGHPIGEINFTYAFTDMFDTNTIWIEKMPRLKDFVPINQEANSITSFNANLCMHYNKLNETGKTRMSMDFRVLPLNYYDKDKVLSSHSTKQKFVDGGYYELFKISNKE
tara:strand:+ start:4988 stop:5701 length:714 start_codon:yes stop_codon:yes gene_type:complete